MVKHTSQVSKAITKILNGNKHIYNLINDHIEHLTTLQLLKIAVLKVNKILTTIRAISKHCHNNPTVVQ